MFFSFPFLVISGIQTILSRIFFHFKFFPLLPYNKFLLLLTLLRATNLRTDEEHPNFNRQVFFSFPFLIISGIQTILSRIFFHFKFLPLFPYNKFLLLLTLLRATNLRTDEEHPNFNRQVFFSFPFLIISRIQTILSRILFHFKFFLLLPCN